MLNSVTGISNVVTSALLKSNVYLNIVFGMGILDYAVDNTK